MQEGVHYCTITRLFKVWIDGFVVAASNDSYEASTIYRSRLQRKRLVGFLPNDRWMVDAYGD